MDIKFINYGGCWPNLCRGILTLELGGVIEDADGGYHIEHGKWILEKDRLSKELIPFGDILIEVFNENVEYWLLWRLYLRIYFDWRQ